MSHTIHTIEAIVLGSHNFGEANRWYQFLTPDFGLVMARAQGVRQLKSKLNGHLSLFSQVQISLVRGKEYWRLIGAEEIGATQPETFSGSSETIPRTRKKSPVASRASLAAQARVAGLLRRLLPEAGADPELFSLVKLGFAVLPQGEITLVWNILRLLGYISRSEIGDSPESVLIGEINHALSHSQL